MPMFVAKNGKMEMSSTLTNLSAPELLSGELDKTTYWLPLALMKNTGGKKWERRVRLMFHLTALASNKLAVANTSKALFTTPINWPASPTKYGEQSLTTSLSLPASKNLTGGNSLEIEARLKPQTTVHLTLNPVASHGWMDSFIMKTKSHATIMLFGEQSKTAF